MTDEQLVVIGAAMWRAARSTNDPVLLEIYKLVHALTITLRMGGPIKLHNQLVHSLGHLERALADK